MFRTPAGMSRRHFMNHLAGASALTASAITLGSSIQANAQTMQKNRKSAIMLWMGGGPSTMDIWDLKPGAPTGGQFRPIPTNVGGIEISEHMPQMAKNMDKVAIVRSMSTREADHGRGRYYMHTGYVPSQSVEHPSYGAVIAHETIAQRPDLEIPPFVAVGGAVGPGFLGMAWAPFTVSSNGQIRDLEMGISDRRVMERMLALNRVEKNFISRSVGSAASDHEKILGKTLKLMTSAQMDAFKVSKEPKEVQDRYGNTNFGRGCLMARRLVEVGVPFIEVDLGGWDNHAGIFPTLQNTKLPELDKAMSALVEDLAARGMLQDTVIIWMGEFSRTPRINGGAGRDHWARSWSVVVGGGKIKGGQAVGATSDDGSEVIGDPYSSEDLMASVCHALDISLETRFTASNGRPMKIANSGKLIKELFS
jgi:hypothetical protein